MDEYIKRETAIRMVMAAKWGDSSDGAMAMEIVASAPAADVAPVVHARWIGAPLCGNDNCKCSNCGSWHNIHANLRGKITQKYCPSCGAKMDGGASIE